MKRKINDIVVVFVLRWTTVAILKIKANEENKDKLQKYRT